MILNLAIANRLRGDEAAALAVLDQAVGAHPDQGMIQYLYSLMLDKRGEPEKAARALDVARKLGIDVEKLPAAGSAYMDANLSYMDPQARCEIGDSHLFSPPLRESAYIVPAKKSDCPQFRLALTPQAPCARPLANSRTGS